MVLLAFDTSTQRMALALWADAQLHTQEQEAGPQASATLLPAARNLLKQAGLDWRDVQGLAYGRGPGAFTGLRTSCSVVQGLALGLGCPVVAVDSLLIVAEDARGQAAQSGPSPDAASLGCVRVAMDARMDQLYAAQYRLVEEGWLTLEPPALWDVPALVAHWGTACDAQVGVMAGSGLGLLAASGLSMSAQTVFPQEHSRAAALARLARQQWVRGERLDAAQAMPLYVRDKVALTTQEREAAR